MSLRPRPAPSSTARLLALGLLLLVAGLAGLTPVAHGVSDPVVEGRAAAATQLRTERPTVPQRRRRRPRTLAALRRTIVGRSAPRPTPRRPSVLAVTSVLRL